MPSLSSTDRIVDCILLFPATVFSVPREGHVPDELQLLPPTLRQLGDASGLPLEQGLEEVAMVGSAFVWAYKTGLERLQCSIGPGARE